MGKHRLTRRDVLAAGTGAVLGIPEVAGAKTVKSSVYEALGVKHVINATGTVTFLGGSLMPPEVVAAWADAARHFVNVLELHDKVGARIAKLVGVEAALVTTGAAGALLLGTAAVVTRGDAKAIQRLPDTRGLRNEVILQRTHHSCYDNQLTDCGVKLIDVETPDDVAKAVGECTALMFFMNYLDDAGKIRREDWVKLARKHKVPTLLDAAADTPPFERMSAYNETGFDLVAFSGGKAIMGPNDTGLLLGKKELIEAAKKNANPHCGTIGRMMKVRKEDMIAALAAVERFVKLDFKALTTECERRIAVIEKAVQELPSVATERITPAIANHFPHLQISWDEKRIKTSREKITRDLLEGDPAIQIGRVSGTGDKGILISVFTLQEGEEKIVAERLRTLLTKAAG
jgi:L-seryl-tRNA(Ser) seleniumtransferase